MTNFYYKNIKWFKSQIKQLKNSNSKLLKYKLKKLSLYFSIFSLTFIFFPLFLIIRFLSGFILIRFANLDSTRIGHFTNDVVIYLTNIVEKKTKFQCDFFYVEKPVCNNALLKIFKRHINIIPEFLIRPFILLNKIKFLGNPKHIIEVNPFLQQDLRDRDIKSEKKINYFNEEDIEYGNSFLKDLGLSKDDKYVCLLCRDEAYTQDVFKNSYNLEYETKGDLSVFRNANIENFIEGINLATKKGYFVFRMGAVKEDLLNINNERFIEYSSLYR